MDSMLKLLREYIIQTGFAVQATTRGPGTPGRQREENPVQIAVSEPEKSAKPTSDGEARG
jgi:hypothetical protein